MQSNTNGQSWGEDLQKYKTMRTTLPWKKEQEVPVKHITRYEKSRQEREYDIVLGKFRDSERESIRSQLSAREKTASWDRAKIKQQKYTQKFNLINHSVVSAEVEKKVVKAPLRHSGYNIISNLDERLQSRAQTAALLERGGRRHHPLAETREFNVLTNRYLSDHETRQQKDKEKAKAIADNKFWKTHDFNPVATTYYSPRKEAEYCIKRADLNKTHGVNRVDQLPISVQQSEGLAFNIISKTVIDEKRSTQIKNKDNRSTNNKNSTKVEQRLRTESEKQAEIHDVRTLNRISYIRQIEPYKKGYDILTMQPYIGRTRKEIAPIKKKPPPCKWKQLENQSMLHRPSNQGTFRDLSGIRRPSTSSTHGHQADVLVIRREEPSNNHRIVENTVALQRQNTPKVPKLNLDQCTWNKGTFLPAYGFF